MHGVGAVVGVVVGIIVILIGLRVLMAAGNQMGQGNCLTGCCLWEMGDSIMDLGSGLIGCGSVFALIVVAVGLFVHHLR